VAPAPPGARAIYDAYQRGDRAEVARLAIRLCDAAREVELLACEAAS